MAQNPWDRLPKAPPFVLPEDKDKVDAFNLVKGNHHKHFLHLTFVPEPFVGNPDARLLLLGNNPGVADPPEGSAFRLKRAFASRMRNNMLHRLSDKFPFLYFDPEIVPPEKDWWDRKLKKVFEQFENSNVAKSALAQHILAVEFFPYASKSFGQGKLRLDSQKYSFGLVRNAVKRDVVIVLTRGEKRWKKAVPELRGYRLLVCLKEVQQAPISPGNCRDKGWSHIQEVIRAIKGI
jgi:hypothetical protein